MADKQGTDRVTGMEQWLAPEFRPGWPRLLLAAFAAGVLLIAAMLLAVRVIGSGEAALIGTDLGKQPAPDFTLTDHRGETVRLSDVRGKAVVLTFIYTNCPDVCPLTAENLRIASELLPEAAQDDVALFAVSLDPARDTPWALQDFTAVHRLADNPNWFALGGNPAVLQQVWQAYGVYPGTSPPTPEGVGTGMVGGGEGHTDAIYFIDPEGRQRAFMRSTATPREIAANLMALLD